MLTQQCLKPGRELTSNGDQVHLIDSYLLYAGTEVDWHSRIARNLQDIFAEIKIQAFVPAYSGQQLSQGHQWANPHNRLLASRKIYGEAMGDLNKNLYMKQIS